MRREQLYLVDIIEVADSLAKFLDTVEKDDFLENDLLKSAALQKLTVIGEAASRLDRGFSARHPEVPWSEMAAFRNLAVHAYSAVNWDIVWNTVPVDVPLLREHRVVERLRAGTEVRTH